MAKKKHELAKAGAGKRLADLAAFYGCQVFGLGTKEVMLLEANLPRLKAAKTLDEIDSGKLSGLHPDTIYDIAFEATGSKAVANSYRVSALKSTWKSR